MADNEKNELEQEGISLDDYLGQPDQSFDDGTPDYVTKQPDKPAGLEQAPKRVDPNQVAGPTSAKPTERLGSDDVVGRVTQTPAPSAGTVPLPNPANNKIDPLSFVRRNKQKQEKTAKATETAKDVAGAVEGKWGDLAKNQLEKRFGNSKLGKKAASAAEDAADIAELVATAGADLRTWWKLLKKHWQLVFWPAIGGALFALILGLAIGLAFSARSGNRGGGIGIPGTSTYLSSFANPNGIYLDIMTDHLNIVDPKTKKAVTTLTLEATSGLYSDETDARRATEANAAGVTGDDGKSIVGRACLYRDGQWVSENGKSGVDCIAGGNIYSLSTGQTTKMTDEELKWYITARWPYVKTNWYNEGSSLRPRTVRNPSQPQKYFQGRKVVLYSPATNKAVLGLVSEWGPAPWTGIPKEKRGTQATMWKYGPFGPEPRIQVPQGYEGRIGGGSTAIRDTLGVASNSPIIMGYLKPDKEAGLSLGLIPQDKYKIVSRTSPALSAVPFLSQKAYPNVPYTSTGDPKQTISSTGCGIVSAAMVLLFNGKQVTVQELAKWSVDNGFRTADKGTAWSFFSAIAKREGLKYTSIFQRPEEAQPTEDEWQAVMSTLRSGKPVIISGISLQTDERPFTDKGHYVVLTGIASDGRITVNDPASTGSRTDPRMNQSYSEAQIRAHNLNFALTIYK